MQNFTADRLVIFSDFFEERKLMKSSKVDSENYKLLGTLYCSRTFLKDRLQYIESKSKVMKFCLASRIMQIQKNECQKWKAEAIAVRSCVPFFYQRVKTRVSREKTVKSCEFLYCFVEDLDPMLCRRTL